MPRIKCQVDSCFFWREENLCGADQIEVAHNFQASPRTDAGQVGAQRVRARHSYETQCLTFRPREADREL